MSATYGVVPHVTRRGPQVDDRGSCRAAGRKGVHMGHDVVPTLLLLPGSQLKIDVSKVGLHLTELFLCDGQPQLLGGVVGGVRICGSSIILMISL